MSARDVLRVSGSRSCPLPRRRQSGGPTVTEILEAALDPIRMAAVLTVTIALTLYTVGTVKQQRSRRSTLAVRGWLTAGVGFDIMATALMIVASRNAGITVHGVLGYSALAFMLTDTILMWRHARAHGQAEVPKRLHLFSRVAYGYWVVAFFTGAALVMAEKAAKG